jgi:hypothetical protein
MKRLFLLASLTIILSACYFSAITIYPSASAFHNVQDSPFCLNGRQTITGMVSDGTRVVAVSREGTIALSEDQGLSWQETAALDIRFNAVTWGEGYFLAGGDFGRAAYSADGKEWETGVIGPMSPKHILALSAGKMKSQTVFAAGGTDGRMAYALNSPAGPWFQITFSPFGELENQGEKVLSIAYGKIKGQGIFVAAGEGGHIAVLKDLSGNVYGPGAMGTQQTFNGVAFGNDRFIAVGDGASMKVSGNPESYAWTTVRERGFGLQPFYNIDFAPCINYFVLVASDSVVGFSENGESWSATSLNAKLSDGISAVACTKKRIVLGGANGSIVYSN